MKDERLILWKSDQTIADEDRREVDRQEVVKLLLSKGFKPVSKEAERMKLIYVFCSKETETVTSGLLAGEDFQISYKAWLAGEDDWKNTLATLKELRNRER